jgi:hypothetical protein
MFEKELRKQARHNVAVDLASAVGAHRRGDRHGLFLAQMRAESHAAHRTLAGDKQVLRALLFILSLGKIK